jgi:hypothetical protein
MQKAADQQAPRDRRWELRWILALRLLLTVAALGSAIHLSHRFLVTMFLLSDDEGHVMLTLVQFLGGLPLYDELFTQYGPFHFQLRGLFQMLAAAPVSHDFTRIVTLATWQFCGLSYAAFIARQTSSFALSFLIYLQAMTYMKSFANEPGHPQETVMLLLSVALLAIGFAGWQRVAKLSLIAGGAVGAFLLLTKVNVGVFYGLSFLLLVANLLPRQPRTEWLAVAIALISAAAPCILMAAHLSSWAATHALVSSTSLLLLALMPRRAQGALAFEWRWAGWLTASAFAAALGVLAVALLMGSSARGLVEGVLLEPLRRGTSWSVGRPLPATAPIAAAIALGIGLVFALRGRFSAPWSARARALLPVVKLAVGLIGIWLTWRIDGGHLLIWVAPFAWLLALPARQEESALRFRAPRLALACLALPQVLQVYPVGGSQLAWATSLLIVCAYLLFHDGLSGIAATSRAWLGSRPLREEALPLLGAALCAATIVPLFFQHPVFVSSEQRFEKSRSLEIPGASWIALPPEHAVTLERLSSRIRQRCDSLTSLPGLGSFNVWSDVPPPTGWNVTAWIFLIDEERQRKSVDGLRAAERPCAVFCRRCLGFWTRGERANLRNQPLVGYILQELSPTVRMGAYELRERPDPQ